MRRASRFDSIEKSCQFSAKRGGVVERQGCDNKVAHITQYKRQLRKTDWCAKTGGLV